MKDLVGKIIEFYSVTQQQRIEAKLLYVNAEYMQVELTRQMPSKNTIWYAGTVRLFNIDKISDVEEVKKGKTETPREKSAWGRPRPPKIKVLSTEKYRRVLDKKTLLG